MVTRCKIADNQSASALDDCLLIARAQCLTATREWPIMVAMRNQEKPYTGASDLLDTVFPPTLHHAMTC